MPVDILGTLMTGITSPIAATASGTGIDLGAGGALPAGTPRRGLVARVLVTTASNASGANTVDFTIDHSSDNATWKTCAGAALGANDTLTLSTSAQSREVFIPFETVQRYIRLTATIAGAGTVPTVSFNAFLAPSLP